MSCKLMILGRLIHSVVTENEKQFMPNFSDQLERTKKNMSLGDGVDR